MKKIILILSFVLSLLYADDPCIAKNVTKEIFTKSYNHNVVIKKYHFEDGCGYQKDTIDIFQNNKKVDTLSAFYGVELRSDKDTDKDGNKKIILTGYTGGHGNNIHMFGLIEPNMKKLFSYDGYEIILDDVDKDGNDEIIYPKSVFFCISGEFCCHACNIIIELALKFENYKLVINKKAMGQQDDSIELCSTDVKLDDNSLKFLNRGCAKNNLISIAYSLHIGDIKKLKKSLNYFKFDTQIAKDKFKKRLLEEIKYLDFIEQNHKLRENEFIKNF